MDSYSSHDGAQKPIGLVQMVVRRVFEVYVGE